MEQPRLWIAYDFTDPAECLRMLDAVVKSCPDEQGHIIHEIGRPTLINAVLHGTRIVHEFRSRLDKGQTLVADFKGFDVPHSAEGKFYIEAGVDIYTVMAAAPDEAVAECLEDGRGSEVAFDLMSYQDDQAKVERARFLVDAGARLISCHTGWNEQAAGKRPDALLDLVSDAIAGTGCRMVAMGGLKPGDVASLKPYVSAGTLFAVVSGSAVTRAANPGDVVKQFLDELAEL